MMAAERWVVDGMNVIGSRPDGWWRDRTAAMRALVQQLVRFARDGGRDVTVVLDGRPREVGGADEVTVQFAEGGPDAADRAIAALVAADAAPGSLSVVTSDGALADQVRSHGARVHTAGTFRRMLDSA
jgi:predicted RNA-binding protein with PIN domain